MEYVDYYKTLEVDRDAPQEEVTKAYKRLARKYHPDLNKAKDAEDRFKQVGEAYEVLKDPEKRQRYDELGANWKHGAPFEPPPGFGGAYGPGGFRTDFRGAQGGGGGFSSFFEGIFGGGGGGGFGRRGFGGGANIEDLFGGAPRAPQRGQDIQSRLRVSLEDVFFAKKPKVTLTLGDGQKKSYDITIPSTVRSGEKIRLGGQGGPGPNGAPAGDLYLEIEIVEHPRYQLDGDDLIVEVDVPAWDAALGAKVPVPTLEGEVKLTLPAGVGSGQRLRLKGKGMHKKGGERGDLYAEVRIVVPKELTEAQKALFEQLRDA